MDSSVDPIVDSGSIDWTMKFTVHSFAGKKTPVTTVDGYCLLSLVSRTHFSARPVPSHLTNGQPLSVVGAKLGRHGCTRAG